MNINKANKQELAYQKGERRKEKLWLAQNHKWIEVQKMLQGYAAGWIDGVAWLKRNKK